eukprot:XP_019919966.1 PREDICTED: uncharacterized protein LOC109617743 [Crassostrea gigas]
MGGILTVVKAFPETQLDYSNSAEFSEIKCIIVGLKFGCANVNNIWCFDVSILYMPDIICNVNLARTASSEITKRTPDNKVYYSLTTDCFVATGRASVAFRERANNDVHIALDSEDSSTCGTHYEIIIGGLNNTQSTISFDIGGNTCVDQSGTFLSQTYFDDFWFSWTGNYVRVALEAHLKKGVS